MWLGIHTAYSFNTFADISCHIFTVAVTLLAGAYNVAKYWEPWPPPPLLTLLLGTAHSVDVLSIQSNIVFNTLICRPVQLLAFVE